MAQARRPNTQTATKPAATNAAPANAAAIEKQVPRHQMVRQRIERVVPYIQQVLPEKLGLSAERFARVTINCIESDDSGKLLQCSDASIIRAVLHAAEVGLEPGGAHALCYILPYWNKKGNEGRGGYDAQFMIGVWGYVELARRNPRIKNVWSDVIFSNDYYKVSSGTSGKVIVHEPRWDLSFEDRGPILGAYACAQLDDGTVSSELMNIEELEQARRTSQAPDSPAWKNWTTEMYKRSAIKRGQKYWPKGADRSISRAIEIEESPTHISLPAQAALATLGGGSGRVAKPRGAALDALVDANAGNGNGNAGGKTEADAPTVEVEADLTPAGVQSWLVKADARWGGDDRLDIIGQWSPAQMRLAVEWSQAHAFAVESGAASEDVPDRPSFTILGRQPGEDA